MKRMSFWFSSIALLALLAFNVMAQDMQKNPDAKPKTAKTKTALPTTDPDILKCIQEKFANAASLKDKPPGVTVTNGVATITGEAKNPGTKGAATRIAKSCGAKEIKNEMTVLAGIKKPAEKKS